MKKSKKIKIIIPAVAFCACLMVFAILELAHVTNLIHFHSKSTSTVATTSPSASQSTPSNKIDYGPAKAEDSTVSPSKSNTSSTPTVSNENISILITSARESGDRYLIKAVISGTTDASCSAIMTKDSQSATASSGATMIEGQYSCENLYIPMSQLSTGTWKLDVTATDKSGSTASDSQEIII
ncbi:hypothetical protein KC930_01295 [Candidatus Saccharibacteria bacterium]|nr:hypothetical protein [Candidatus Saccharibacteria bacterium]